MNRKIGLLIPVAIVICIMFYFNPNCIFTNENGGNYRQSTDEFNPDIRQENSLTKDYKQQGMKTWKSSNPSFGTLILKWFSKQTSNNHSQQTRIKPGNFTKKNNVLSYSLFGKNSFKKYKKNIISVLTEARKSFLYHSWTVRIYTDIIIPPKFIKKMHHTNPKVQLVNVTKLGHAYPNLQRINAMIWRFLPMCDPTVAVSCFRDLDSPLYKREEHAVREFLYTDYIFHGMRDNPYHTSLVMGGMWCYRNLKNQQLGQMLLNLILQKAQHRFPNVREANKGDDQTVLNRHLWPVIKNDALVHDSFFCSRSNKPKAIRPFPTKRQRSEPFVGCATRPCEYDFKMLKCPSKCRPKEHQNWKYC